jgi:hypothetical protein
VPQQQGIMKKQLAASSIVIGLSLSLVTGGLAQTATPKGQTMASAEVANNPIGMHSGSGRAIGSGRKKSSGMHCETDPNSRDNLIKENLTKQRDVSSRFKLPGAREVAARVEF